MTTVLRVKETREPVRLVASFVEWSTSSRGRLAGCSGGRLDCARSAKPVMAVRWLLKSWMKPSSMKSCRYFFFECGSTGDLFSQ